MPNVASQERRACLRRLVVVTAFVVGLPRVAHTQSLAEAAKKASEQQSTANGQASTGPVYTNADLVDENPSPSAQTKAPAAPVTPATIERAPDRRDERWWRTRMTQLRSQLAHDDSLCVPTRDRVARLTALVATLPEPTPTVVNGRYRTLRSPQAQLDQAKAALAQCEARVTTDKAAIAAAEEDARVHRVLPGWLR
jgi:hypothetical protein